MTNRWTPVVVGTVLASALALPSHAQKTADLAQVTVWKTKPGAAAAFAEGRKRHMDFHRQQKDGFAWLTWEIVTGDQVGQFLTGTFGHFWKDFDGREKFDELDAADLAKTTGPHAEISYSGFYVRIEEASRSAPGAGGPAKFSQVTHFFVEPAAVPAFEDALKEIKSALDQIAWPVYSSWYRLASGGEGPHYVLSIARDSYAAFAPPEKSLIQGVSEAVGPARAAALFETTRNATRSTSSEILQYRPDLSYVPAGQ